MKFAWIQQHRNSFPITTMCEVLQVSKSGKYTAIERLHQTLDYKTSNQYEAEYASAVTAAQENSPDHCPKVGG